MDSISGENGNGVGTIEDLPPAPSKLKSCVVLRDHNKTVVGLMLDDLGLDSFDFEILLGVDAEIIYLEPENPIYDIVSRIAGI